MAAPTVGAVMADILPYLGVKQSFKENEAAGKVVVLDDFTGMTADDVKKQLKNLSLTARIIGTGDTVTGQIPQGGQSVPGNSEILIYLGVPAPAEDNASDTEILSADIPPPDSDLLKSMIRQGRAAISYFFTKSEVEDIAIGSETML